MLNVAEPGVNNEASWSTSKRSTGRPAHYWGPSRLNGVWSAGDEVFDVSHLVEVGCG